MTALVPARHAAGAAPPPAGPRVEEPATPKGHLSHTPALDGLRGLAVIGVIAFHAGLPWAKGGFLGVSTFFTLSGFLITALLLRERASDGRITLGSFWARRARRLLPAAFAAIAVAVLFGALAADRSQVDHLLGDVVASLTYTANWHFIIEDFSYGDLFAPSSPLLHFWSLAIEEQFYILFPLLMLALLGRRRGRRMAIPHRRLLLVLSALAAGSVALAASGLLPFDRVYFGTDTRAAEVLIGAILAVVMFGSPWGQRFREGTTTPPRLAGVAGVAALTVALACWVVVPEGAAWLGRGGLALYALLTATIIMSVLVPGSATGRLLAWGPLCRVGLVSYGLYLFHWPIFKWVEQGSDLDGGTAVAVALTATTVLTLTSYRLLEQPIRRGARLWHLNPAWLVAPAAVALVAMTVKVADNPPAPEIDFDGAARQTYASGPPPTAAPAEIPPPRFAFYGDSTAMMTSFGVNAHAKRTGEFTVAEGEAEMGCGIAREGLRKHGPLREEAPAPEECTSWAATWPVGLAAGQPNVAVVQTGPWDVLDRQLPDDVWREPGDPVFDAYLLSELIAATDALSADGRLVIWLSVPYIEDGDDGRTAEEIHGPDAERSRFDVLNSLIREVRRQRPDTTRIVDLAGWLASSGDDARLRPDGTHFSMDTAVEVADDWLAAELVDTYTEWAGGRPPDS